ncbi:MAG: hypothetical protein ACHQIL_00170 [Steroidobacterales bacterium]
MIIAGHAAIFDAQGQLRPWTSWNAALDLEMQFYRQCPLDHGYPRFACVSHLDADWNPYPERTDTIPATQNGMGIISYLKFHELRGKRDAGLLAVACSMGDYLVNEALTPDGGRYPLFVRSTGRRGQFPQPADSGSQGDRPFEIEPDKGGIAGYALALLFEATAERRYLDLAVRCARVLAANQTDGDAVSSPWPFRVDYRDGGGRGPVSGNMSYILRLYDSLAAQGFREFSRPRHSLWSWVRRHQIPSAAADGALFAQFFEDHETPTNRSAWAPLNLARYLLEQRDLAGPGWLGDCATLIGFVRRNFIHRESGITVCHEQDEDRNAWGGVNSTYGAVLALYARAAGSPDLAREARQALDFTLYSIDAQGRPRDLFKNAAPGGWQEDAHTDVIHNYADALRAFPEWGEAT